MTDTINVLGVRVGPTEARVLAMHAADLAADDIIAKTGEAPVTVSRILNSIPGGGRAGAGRIAATWMVRTGWTATQAPPAPVTAPRSDDAISDLISRAVATDSRKLTTLADKISDLVEELEAYVVEHEQTAKLRAEAEELEARLAEIRAQLPGSPTGRRRTDPLIDPKAIRVWAAENNVDCPKLGRVPATVVAAYERARAGQAPT